MVTDEIVPYFWTESEMKDIKGNFKAGITMKKILTEFPLYFSLSYINIVHEIIGLNNLVKIGETPRILVCEISENFYKDSEIIKAAKEKFLDKINKEKRKLI